MNRTRVGLFVACASTLSHVALAGPPLMTDDPGTPGPNAWEINLAGDLEYGPSQESVEGPLLDVGYGIGRRWELGVAAAWVWSGALGDTPSGSMGSAELSAKWRFLGEADRGFALSFSPQFDFNPQDVEEYGLLHRGTALELPFQVGWSTEKFQVIGDAGYVIAIQNTDVVWAGAAGIGEIKEALDLMAEVHVEVPGDASSVEVVANAGFTYEFNETFALLASAGSAAWTGGPDFLAYAGLQCDLGVGEH